MTTEISQNFKQTGVDALPELFVETSFLDLCFRLQKLYGAVAAKDFSGSVVPYYYPAAGFAARVGIDWTF